MSGSTEVVGNRGTQPQPALPADLTQLLQTLLGDGLSLRQIQAAVLAAYGDGTLDSGDQQSLRDFIRDLPQALRASVEDGGIEQLPPGQFRDVVERALDPAQAQRGPAPAGVAPGGALETARPAELAGAFVDTRSGNAQPAPAGSTLASQLTASPQFVERAPIGVQLAATQRSVDGSGTTRVVETGATPLTVDRSTLAPQTQMQTQTQTIGATPHARADAMPNQVLPPVVAGAPLLVNPQPVALQAQVSAPLPPGTEQAAAQARNATIVPAGHTIAGLASRDPRERMQAPRHRMDWTRALLPARSKRADTGDAVSSGFQWLFWILTLVAYAGLIIAVVALIPGGSGLSNGFGRPSGGGIALVLGGIAAIASWFVGKRLVRQAEKTHD